MTAHIAMISDAARTLARAGRLDMTPLGNLAGPRVSPAADRIRSYTGRMTGASDAPGHMPVT